MNDYCNLQHKSEVKFFTVVKLFAILTMILGIMGLVGLISIIFIQKNRQIGIRKVMGANFNQILFFLNNELIFLIII